MAKNTLNSTLSGVGNSKEHQLIISDLLYSIRKSIANYKKQGYYVLSEYSLINDNTNRDYNIDLQLFTSLENVTLGMPSVAIEVTRRERFKEDEKKIQDCFKNNAFLEECFIVVYNDCFVEGFVKFERGAAPKETSHCKLLGKNGVNLFGYIVSVSKKKCKILKMKGKK